MIRLDGVGDGGDSKGHGKDEVPFETGVEAVVGVAGRGGDVAVGGGDGGGAGGGRGGCWGGGGVHFEIGERWSRFDIRESLRSIRLGAAWFKLLDVVKLGGHI